MHTGGCVEDKLWTGEVCCLLRCRGGLDESSCVGITHRSSQQKDDKFDTPMRLVLYDFLLEIMEDRVEDRENVSARSLLESNQCDKPGEPG